MIWRRRVRKGRTVPGRKATRFRAACGGVPGTPCRGLLLPLTFAIQGLPLRHLTSAVSICAAIPVPGNLQHIVCLPRGAQRSRRVKIPHGSARAYGVSRWGGFVSSRPRKKGFDKLQDPVGWVGGPRLQTASPGSVPPALLIRTTKFRALTPPTKIRELPVRYLLRMHLRAFVFSRSAHLPSVTRT